MQRPWGGNELDLLKGQKEVRMAAHGGTAAAAQIREAGGQVLQDFVGHPRSLDFILISMAAP